MPRGFHSVSSISRLRIGQGLVILRSVGSVCEMMLNSVNYICINCITTGTIDTIPLVSRTSALGQSVSPSRLCTHPSSPPRVYSIAPTGNHLYFLPLHFISFQRFDFVCTCRSRIKDVPQPFFGEFTGEFYTNDSLAETQDLSVVGEDETLDGERVTGW